MHMKTRKRFLALVAAAAMVLAPCTAFAITDQAVDVAPGKGGGTVSGEVEGWLKKEVFSVVVPTLETGDLNFILDPQGLIADSVKNGNTNSKYDGMTFEANKSLFFKYDATNYKATSPDLKITSKSSMPVDVTVEIDASESGLSFATDSAFNNNENPEVYLAIKGVTTNAVAVDPETKKASASKTVDEVASTNFQVRYDDDKQDYVYEMIPTTTSDQFKSLTFNITGACNTAADWSSLVDVEASVGIVWNVKPHSDGPSVTVSPSGLITVSGLTGELNMSSDEDNLMLGINEDYWPVNWDAVDADLGNWKTETGGYLTIQLKGNYNIYNDNSTFTIKVKLTDGTYISWSGPIHIG